MKPITVTKTLGAASANSIALSQTPVSGTPLTLNGAAVTGGVATLDTQRRVLLTYGSEGAPRTLTLAGANDAGIGVTEILAVPSGAGGTVASSFDYKTITRATPTGGGWTAAVTLGTNTIGATPWFIPDADLPTFALAFGTVLLSGSPTWSIEIPNEDPKAPIPSWGETQQPAPIVTTYSLAGLTDATANATAAASPVPILGWRLIVTGPGSVKAIATQAGLTSP